MDIASLLNQLIMEQYNATPPVLNTPKAPGQTSPMMWEASAFPNMVRSGMPGVAEYSRYEDMQIPPTQYMQELLLPQAQRRAEGQDPSQNRYRSIGFEGIGPTNTAASFGYMSPLNRLRKY